MGLSIADFTTQLAALTAQYGVDSDETAYADGLAVLYAQYDSVGTLSANIGALLTIKTAMLNAARVVDPDGTVALVSDLPSGAAEGAAYVVSSNGHLYIRVSGLWNDAGVFTAGWLTISAAYTALSGQCLLCDTSTAGFDLTLPATPVEGASLRLRDAVGTWGSVGKAVTLRRNGSTIEGLAQDALANLANVELLASFSGVTWRLTTSNPY